MSAASDPKALHPTATRRRQPTLARWSRSSPDPKTARPSRLQTPCSPHHRSFGGDLWLRAPLLRFVRPFNASGWLRPLSHRRTGSSRGVACRFVPPSPFRRPRRFAPHPSPPGFPRTTLMGFRLTLQGFPPREDHTVPGVTFPSWTSWPALPPQSLPLPPSHRSFRGLLLEATVVAHIRFPSCEDSSPSWASLCGTSLRPLASLPEGGSIRGLTGRSRHVFRIVKERRDPLGEIGRAHV